MFKALIVIYLVLVLSALTLYGQARTAERVMFAPFSQLFSSLPDGSTRTCINCTTNASGTCTEGTTQMLAMKLNGVWKCSNLVTASGTSGLVDPGSNGIIKRTALNTTVAAVAGTDYLTPTGDGSGLTNLNASNLSSGIVATARGGFGANVSAAAGVPFFTAGAPAFTATTGTGVFVRSDTPSLTTPAIGNFLNALHGHIDATGGGQLNASSVFSAGIVPAARLGSGTIDGTRFLRDDNTWQIIPGGGDALTTNPLSQFAATTSAQLAGVISNETGSGFLVFGTSPVLTTPRITTGIDDSSGGRTINFTVTGSANAIDILNAAAGSGPRIRASGSDTNISLDFAGKGTGRITFLDGTDNTKKLSWDLAAIGTGQNRVVTVPNSDVVLPIASSAPANQFSTGLTSGGVLTYAQPSFSNLSGTANAINGTMIAMGSDAQGDILYYNGTDYARLPAGSNGQFLKTLGAGANPVWATAAGAGDVIGPASATDNAIARYDATTGKLIQNSGVTIDDSNNIAAPGSVLIGHTAALGRLGQPFEVTVNANYGGGAFNTFSTTADESAVLDFNRSKSGTKGTQTIVASSDHLGQIFFRGSNGTDFLNAAAIKGSVDGTPGASDMPGRISFWTTPDGSVTVTERWRVNNAGHFLAASDNTTDIGASGATRPRTGYFGTSVVAPSLLLPGSTSGTVTVNTAAAAGTWTLTLPTTDGTSGQVLQTNGSGVTTWATIAGTGDFVGPASSTDNAVVRFDGTTGKAGQNSGVTIDDSNNVTVPGTLNLNTASGTDGILVVSSASSGGGVQLTTGTKPTCDSTKRFLIWAVAGGAGVADTAEICTKNSSDVYAWRALF